VAYYPQIVSEHHLVVFGSRATDQVYAVDYRNGQQAWRFAVNGELQATEQADVGVVVGSTQQVTLLDYKTGKPRSGWPVTFAQHEQALAAGDLDNDGRDELALNSNDGRIEVRNRDASLRFKLSAAHTHVDLHFIGNILHNREGNELLTVIDNDDSSNGEGDELVLLDDQGQQLRHYALESGGPNLAVGDLSAEHPGKEIVYGLEGSGTVGLLTNQLAPIRSGTVETDGNGAGQVALADLNGDGTLQIIINSGEHPEAGLNVLNAKLQTVARTRGQGWDLDPMASKPNGAWNNKHFPDIDEDGRDEVHASRLGSFRSRWDDHEVIYLHEGK
jgi:hypothetical protein